MIVWACVDIADGLATFGLRHGPDHHLGGVPAYVAVAGLIAFGSGSVGLGLFNRKVSKLLLIVAFVGLMAWFAINVYAVITQPAR